MKTTKRTEPEYVSAFSDEDSFTECDDEIRDVEPSERLDGWRKLFEHRQAASNVVAAATIVVVLVLALFATLTEIAGAGTSATRQVMSVVPVFGGGAAAWLFKKPKSGS